MPEEIKPAPEAPDAPNGTDDDEEAGEYKFLLFTSRGMAWYAWGERPLAAYFPLAGDDWLRFLRAFPLGPNGRVQESGGLGSPLFRRSEIAAIGYYPIAQEDDDLIAGLDAALAGEEEESEEKQPKPPVKPIRFG